MRRFLRKSAVRVLGSLARLVRWRAKPRIIAVTGSVGKTTTKELIARMLEHDFRLRASRGGYNSEFGVPLTILDRSMPTGLVEWLSLVWRGLGAVIRPGQYPELLVLEMAADRPGDLAYLSTLAPPDVAVITAVQPVHLENYDSIEDIAHEKSQPVRALKPDGLAVLNFDDTRVRMMRAVTKASVSFYGLDDESNVWADSIKQTPAGMTAVIHVREEEASDPTDYQLTTPLLGKHQLSGILAAFAVAYALGVAPERALAAMEAFTPPPGRLTPLPGRGRSLILDDSYNSSPQAALASLEVLKEFPKPHRAVLGEMRELGESSEELHRMVGQSLGWLDELITVGPQAAPLAAAAQSAGAKRVHQVDVTPAAIPLTGQWRSGTILVKGSQNTLYLERVVESLLRDPADRDRLNHRLDDPRYSKPLAVHEAASRSEPMEPNSESSQVPDEPENR